MDKSVTEIIESWNQYLQNVKLESGNLPNEIRSGFNQENIINLQNLLEGTQWLHQVVSILLENDNYYKPIFSEIFQALHEMNEALELNDYNLVADILEYEVFKLYLEMENLTIN